MVYESIGTAAFVPDPAAGPFIEAYSTLAFPTEWKKPILDLYQHDWKHKDPDGQVPIRRLNAAIRAIAPDLVSVARRATIDASKPWLYTRNEYKTAVITPLILNWLHDLKPKPEDFPLVKNTIAQLDLGKVGWDLTSVDLLEHTVSAGGTSVPGAHLYHLLPEILAERIAALPPYEFCGDQVTFQRVATAEGAELMSWPPVSYKPRARPGRTSHTWHYSGTIKITLRNEPFSPVPRIHLSVGIRRWVRDSFEPDGRSVGVYLRTDGTWLAGGPESAEPPRFALAYLGYNRRAKKITWTGQGPQGILEGLSVSREFPRPEDLMADAEAWISGKDGIQAAVMYHTTMGYHGVGAGLMPDERQRLVNWAAQALVPQFRPVGAMTRSALPSTPKRVLAPKVSVPKKDDTPEAVAKQESALAKKTANALSDARLRRDRVAKAVGGGHVLSCHLLYQGEEVRDELFRAAERSLDLAGYRTVTEANHRVWRAPDLQVRIRAVPLGELGNRLGGSGRLRKGKETQEAIKTRRTEVKSFIDSLDEKESQAVLVELEGVKHKEFFPRQRDPKFAIRLGCADAGRVSQFIQPEQDQGDGDQEEDNEKGTLEHRADKAWGDVLRQVGMSLVPRHSLGDAIPEDLNQLAFWIVRRNVAGVTRDRQFTPIAVLIRPGQDHVLGRMPGMEKWVPYPELLRQLTGQVRGDELKYEDQQREETAKFVRKALYSLRGEPTLVLTRAHNVRASWNWLQDLNISRDKVQVGDGPVQDLALHGKHLRLIRVRDDERDETPEWWGVQTEDGKPAGQPKGLWLPPGTVTDTDSRVFYATAAKGATHSKIGVDFTKLTHHLPQPRKPKEGEDPDQSPRKAAINPGKNASNPVLLEITVEGVVPGDDPETWAMYTHQQRLIDERPEGLKLPLILHLAEKAAEYALPHEPEVLEEAGEEPSDDPDRDPDDEAAVEGSA